MVEGGLGKLKYVSRVGKKLVKGTGAVYQICESVMVILDRTPSRPKPVTKNEEWVIYRDGEPGAKGKGSGFEEVDEGRVGKGKGGWSATVTEPPWPMGLGMMSVPAVSPHPVAS